MLNYRAERQTNRHTELIANL